MRTKRLASAEFFSPHFLSEARSSSVTSAVINLISTIIGGGVLSLPFAFRRSGLVLGIFMLLATGAASDFTVYTLVSCSRRSGARTFEGVAEKAFGRWAKIFCMVLVILVTYLPSVAYTILLRDLLAPVVEGYILKGHNPKMSLFAKDCMVYVLLLCILPACLTRSLDKLKALSLGSVLSILLLAAAVMTRSVQCGQSKDMRWGQVEFGPEDGWRGALQAIPIFVCAFVCHFNVLPVHGELHRPSRRRLHRLVHWTMGVVTVFYLAVGLSGYFYGVCVGHVSDNILNDFDPSDIMANIGRLGLVGTVMLSFPLMVVPCRDTIIRLSTMAMAQHRRAKYASSPSTAPPSSSSSPSLPSLLPPPLSSVPPLVPLLPAAASSSSSSSLPTLHPGGGGGGKEKSSGNWSLSLSRLWGRRRSNALSSDNGSDGVLRTSLGRRRRDVMSINGQDDELHEPLLSSAVETERLTDMYYVAGAKAAADGLRGGGGGGGSGGSGGGGGNSKGGGGVVTGVQGAERGRVLSDGGEAGVVSGSAGVSADSVTTTAAKGTTKGPVRGYVSPNRVGSKGCCSGDTTTVTKQQQQQQHVQDQQPRSLQGSDKGHEYSTVPLVDEGGGRGVGMMSEADCPACTFPSLSVPSSSAGRVAATVMPPQHHQQEHVHYGLEQHDLHSHHHHEHHDDDDEQDAMDAAAPFRVIFLLTVGLLGSAAFAASFLTRVTDVWGLLGSSANTMVAFIIPCGAYIRIRRYRHIRPGKRWKYARKRTAMVLLVVSCVLAVVCTTNQIVLLSEKSAPSSG